MKVNHSTDEENATKLVALLEQIIEDVREHGAAGAEWKISVETATGEDVRFRYELDVILDRGIAVPGWTPFWLGPRGGARSDRPRGSLRPRTGHRRTPHLPGERPHRAPASGVADRAALYVLRVAFDEDRRVATEVSGESGQVAYLAVRYDCGGTTPIAVFADESDAETFLENSKAGDEEQRSDGVSEIIAIPFYPVGDRSLRFDRYWSAGIRVWEETGAMTPPRTCLYLADLRDDNRVVDKAILPMSELPVVDDDRGHWSGEVQTVRAKAATKEEAVRLARERADEVAQWLKDRRWGGDGDD